MRENMPGTHGWLERGPSKLPEESHPQEFVRQMSRRFPAAGAAGVFMAQPYSYQDGPVTTMPGGVAAPPLTQAEVAEIIRQGKEDPRRLDLEESRLAGTNRAKSREDSRTFDSQIEKAFLPGERTPGERRITHANPYDAPYGISGS